MPSSFVGPPKTKLPIASFQASFRFRRWKLETGDCYYRITSVARLSPRIISTVGIETTTSGTVCVTGWPAAAFGRADDATWRTAAGALAVPTSAAVLIPGVEGAP